MTGALLPAGYETLEDANGVTVPGGLIWTYAAGTTTPLGTYTDNTLGVLNANPILADGAGRWSAWAPPGTGYKLVFETPAIPPVHGATIKTVDNVVAPLTDATAGATGGVTVVSDNTTGLINNFVLAGRTKDTLWAWNGSADLTLTGIAGGVQGDRITIKNMSTVANRRLLLPHMSASSTNAFYNVMQGTLTHVLPTGWATYVFVGGTWVMTDHEQGQWYTRPFSAANYAAAAGTWIPSSATADGCYFKGRTLHFNFDVTGPLSAPSSQMIIQLPVSGAPTTAASLIGLLVSVAGPEPFLFFTSGTTMGSIRIGAPGGNVAAGSVRVAGTLTCEVT